MNQSLFVTGEITKFRKFSLSLIKMSQITILLDCADVERIDVVLYGKCFFIAFHAKFRKSQVFAVKVGHFFRTFYILLWSWSFFQSVLLQQIGALTWNHCDTVENHIAWMSLLGFIYQIQNIIDQGQVVVDLRYLTQFSRLVFYSPWSSFCLSFCVDDIGPVQKIAESWNLGNVLSH